MNDNNEAPRFDVRYRRHKVYGHDHQGWAVFFDGEPITILFLSRGDAEDAMGRIEIIYKRYGWA